MEPLPYDLYRRFPFAPVMKPAKPLRRVKLSGAAYPTAIESLDWLVGGYLENRRGMYSSDLFKDGRFIHLGIDIWAPAGEPVFAVADGFILGAADNSLALDYGPTLVTAHEVLGYRFYLLYGHLSRDSIGGWKAGDAVGTGQPLAKLGTRDENGGWWPHLHFQIGLKEPAAIDMPGVCKPEDVPDLRLLHPDPHCILGHMYPQDPSAI